jgi:hypothetical protein
MSTGAHGEYTCKEPLAFLRPGFVGIVQKRLAIVCYHLTCSIDYDQCVIGYSTFSNGDFGIECSVEVALVSCLRVSDSNSAIQASSGTRCPPGRRARCCWLQIRRDSLQ